MEHHVTFQPQDHTEAICREFGQPEPGLMVEMDGVCVPFDPNQLLSHLDAVSRAYQVLYAIQGDTDTPETLTGNEARALIGIVSDVYDGQRTTPLDCLLAGRMSVPMMRYVTEGGIR